MKHSVALLVNQLSCLTPLFNHSIVFCSHNNTALQLSQFLYKGQYLNVGFQGRHILEYKDNMLFLSGEIDHFTVACLVAWLLNESEASGDLDLIEISLLFLC